MGEDYSVESGSTIITLFPSYLDKLKDGHQTLEIAFIDGVTVEEQFYVEAEEKPIKSIYIDGVLVYSEDGGEQLKDVSYFGLLAQGTHTLKAVYTDGSEVEEGFDIEPNEQPSAWAIPDVVAALEAGLVPYSLLSGYTDQITRAEYCALAVMLFEQYKGSEITQRKVFEDTNDVNVEKMAAIGVVEGVGNNRFDPNGLLTREQAATMISRLANAVGQPLAKQESKFSDNSSISTWAIEGVGQVQAAGIMQGVGANIFAPKNPYTKEQSIITMIRLWNTVK